MLLFLVFRIFAEIAKDEVEALAVPARPQASWFRAGRARMEEAPTASGSAELLHGRFADGLDHGLAFLDALNWFTVDFSPSASRLIPEFGDLFGKVLVEDESQDVVPELVGVHLPPEVAMFRAAAGVAGVVLLTLSLVRKGK